TINKVVAVLGGADVARVENLGVLAQPSSVPFVLSGTPPVRPAADLVFYTGMTAEQQGQVLARFADQQLKTKNIAIVTDGNRTALVEAFSRSLSKGAGAGQWQYKSGDKIQSLVGEVLSKKPDALLFVGSLDDLAEFTRTGSEKTPVLFGG